jgi:hypothetical protein
MNKHVPTKKTDTLHAELPPVLVLVAVGTCNGHVPILCSLRTGVSNHEA